MADQQNGQSGTVLLAFVVGAIAGAAVALLWAPASSRACTAVGKSVSTAVEKGKEAFGQATGRGPKESA